MCYYAYYKEFGDCNVYEFSTEAERDEWVSDEETVLTRLPLNEEWIIEALFGQWDTRYVTSVNEFNPRQIDHISKNCNVIYPE